MMESEPPSAVDLELESIKVTDVIDGADEVIEDHAVGHAVVNLISMNLAGRFNGREIKHFGQEIIRNILVEKNVGVFFGQQINFKPLTPPQYEYIGAGRAFILYDKDRFRVVDDKQYRHFLRDLHARGLLSHNYLPESNYAISKMRYKHKPWAEFIAISWMTDEKASRVKSIGLLKKLFSYTQQLSEIEEMPVVIGGTFRVPFEVTKTFVEGKMRCYGYVPMKPRREMRMSDYFVCSKPLRLADVKPLVCAKMDLGEVSLGQGKWFNPEDAFYWDPAIAELVMPITTPDELPNDRPDGRVRGRSGPNGIGVPSKSSYTNEVNDVVRSTSSGHRITNHSFRKPSSRARPPDPPDDSHIDRGPSIPNGFPINLPALPPGGKTAFLASTSPDGSDHLKDSLPHHRSSSSARLSNLRLPTASVPPAPQRETGGRRCGGGGGGIGSNRGGGSHSTPPTSPTTPTVSTATTRHVAPSSAAAPPARAPSPQLSAITEVSSDAEHAADGSSCSDALRESAVDSETSSTGSSDTSQTLTRGNSSMGLDLPDHEEKVFQMLEAMMNDKNSQYYVSGPGSADHRKATSSMASSATRPLVTARDQVDGDLALFNRVSQKVAEEMQSLAEEKENSRPTRSVSMVTLAAPGAGKKGTDEVGAAGCRERAADDTCLARRSTRCRPVSDRKAASYRELYDEELIAGNQTCYMS